MDFSDSGNKLMHMVLISEKFHRYCMVQHEVSVARSFLHVRHGFRSFKNSSHMSHVQKTSSLSFLKYEPVTCQQTKKSMYRSHHHPIRPQQNIYTKKQHHPHLASLKMTGRKTHGLPWWFSNNTNSRVHRRLVQKFQPKSGMLWVSPCWHKDDPKKRKRCGKDTWSFSSDQNSPKARWWFQLLRALFSPLLRWEFGTYARISYLRCTYLTLRLGWTYTTYR